jgi:hypothetical protein
MPDIHNKVILKPAPRGRDRALAPLLPHSTFSHLHNILAAKKLYWLDDVLDVTGTKLAHHNALHLGIKDWQMLYDALAPTHQLLHTTDPLPQGSHMIPFEECFSKKIVYSRPSNYGSKNYCVALSGPPLGLNDYSLAPPTRRLQQNRTASTNG